MLYNLMLQIKAAHSNIDFCETTYVFIMFQTKTGKSDPDKCRPRLEQQMSPSVNMPKKQNFSIA